MKFFVVYQPITIGVGSGHRGMIEEINSPAYSTREEAIANKDTPLKDPNSQPRNDYVSVKVIDQAGNIYRQRTAGHHVAPEGALW